MAILLTGAFLGGGLLPEGWPVPDLPLLVVCACALRLDWRYALGLAFGTGVAFDILTMHTLGLNALFFTVIASLLHFTAQDQSANSTLRAVLFTFLAALLYRSLYLFSLRLLGYPDVIQAETFLRVILPSVILDALLMPLFYWLIFRLSRPPREV